MISYKQYLFGQLYRLLLKPVLFRFDPEFIHERFLDLGAFSGNNNITKLIFKKLLYFEDPCLTQTISDIKFENPIGLSAGFDYEAKLTQINPKLGFGFQTVGTITKSPYKGNTKPRLARLPKSKSLLVNKGFKNEGMVKIASKLSGLSFKIPTGISIGRTNNPNLSQSSSVLDICDAFVYFEKDKIQNDYYELNISCPNLLGNITFYKPQYLDDLLNEVDKIQIKKPIFIKMPIILPDKDTLKLLDIISKHSPKGVIIGNLQNNRRDPSLKSHEVIRCKSGNFSGKPTYSRSNELIKLTYENYKDRFVIIGCGGVFSAEDAYTKIKLGASLIQLITGMIYQGPQLISEINIGLKKLLEKDGYRNISEAIGINNS